MPNEKQPTFKEGSLVKLKGEFLLEGKWVYLDDYDSFGESIPILGISLKYNRESECYDVMVGGEVVRTFEHELELVEENHRREFDDKGLERFDNSEDDQQPIRQGLRGESEVT